MKTRLKQLRKNLGFTQGEFGKKIGMSDVAISYMESGRTALSEQNVKLICLTFGIREEWFRYGTGDMIDEEAELANDEKLLLEFFRKLSPTAQKMAINYVEQLIVYEKELRENYLAAAEQPVDP
jgi:transcriptional regulator with XRE-family HTH domain